MKEYIEERCMALAEYIVRTGATVRETAKHFCVSKSGVHKDMNERLRFIHTGLYEEVQAVLSYNKSVRHLRGGEATRQKYLRQKEKI